MNTIIFLLGIVAVGVALFVIKKMSPNQDH